MQPRADEKRRRKFLLAHPDLRGGNARKGGGKANQKARDSGKEIVSLVELGGLGPLRKTRHILLDCDDLKAVNTADDPRRVLPRELIPGEATVLPRHSWNVICWEY